MGAFLVTLTLAAFAVAGASGAAAQAVPEQPGAQFATACAFDHTAPVDPITDDSHPHMHDFFGNASTDRSSTHESLRAAETSCNHRADRSAYWTPAVMWDGEELVPSRASIYYRAAEKDHERVRPHPSALKVIAGGFEQQTRVTWSCGREDKTRSQSPPDVCESGVLSPTVHFPDCWDGRNLDSADHRRHLEYAKDIDGARRCPGSHPMPLPSIDATFFYDLPADNLWGQEVLVSTGHGSWSGSAHYHADFFNAWDRESLTTLVQKCINNTKPTAPLPDECRNPRPASRAGEGPSTPPPTPQGAPALYLAGVQPSVRPPGGPTQGEKKHPRAGSEYADRSRRSVPRRRASRGPSPRDPGC